MIGLLVNSKDCHLRLKARGIVECPDLNNERPWACRATGANCSAAGRTEEACHWPFEVLACKAGRCSLGKTKSLLGYYDDRIWIAAGDVLALAAMALHGRRYVTIKAVSDLSTIAPTFNQHILLLCHRLLIVFG